MSPVGPPGASAPHGHAPCRGHLRECADDLRDQSKRPRTSPNATRAKVVEKTIRLRQHYHFGPGKIQMYLKRYHDIEISKSGVWRILHRLDMGRLPDSQRCKRLDLRWRRYDKQSSRQSHPGRCDVR